MAKDPAFLLSKMEVSCIGPPIAPGVYAVCLFNPFINKERILYIGSSKNIQARVTQEKHPYYRIYRRFINWPVYTKSLITNDYRNIEFLLIKHVKPLLNVRCK
jgi:excinuclease UvrABC nuclease subunit